MKVQEVLKSLEINNKLAVLLDHKHAPNRRLILVFKDITLDQLDLGNPFFSYDLDPKLVATFRPDADGWLGACLMISRT